MLTDLRDGNPFNVMAAGRLVGAVLDGALPALLTDLYRLSCIQYSASSPATKTP